MANEGLGSPPSAYSRSRILSKTEAGQDSDDDEAPVANARSFFYEKSNVSQMEREAMTTTHQRTPRGNTDDVSLTWDQVLMEEAEEIRDARSHRQEPESDRPKIAIALSGGGMRAASFQAGVLWRMAELGMLKDVDYWSAVSGGGYISASFATHLRAAPMYMPKRAYDPDPEASQEPDRSPTDSLYLTAIARTIVQMQKNAGNFFRDPVLMGPRKPLKEKVRAMIRREPDDWPPHFLDGFFFFLSALSQLILNPCIAVILYVVPTTELLHLFFGAGLRAVYCLGWHGDDWDISELYQIMSKYSPASGLYYIVRYGGIVVFVLYIVRGFVSKGRSPDATPEQVTRFLLVKNTVSLSIRLYVCVLLLVLVLAALPFMQHYVYGPGLNSTDPTSPSYCLKYAQAASAQSNPISCSDFLYHDEQPWYEQSKLGEYAQQAPALSNWTQTELPHEDDFNFMSIVWYGFSSILVAALIATPFFPGLFMTVALVGGPIVLFGLLLQFFQYRVFGPVSGRTPDFMDFIPTTDKWYAFVTINFVVLIPLVPFYNDIRCIWHNFYCSCMRHNFLHDSKDISLTEIADNPYCPFMLFPCIISDYRVLGSEATFQEITFSPLHTGGKGMEFMRTPKERLLSKVMALTSAGGLDAIVLTMTSQLRFRFWLEMVNLKFGDFILFMPSKGTLPNWVHRWFGDVKEERGIWLKHRLPGALLWVLIIVLFWMGWAYSELTDEPSECIKAKSLLLCPSLAIFITLCGSFYAFLPQLSFLMFSPAIRQLHSVTRHVYEAPRPPGMLYVTDGGVLDCTSIMPLLLRKCERILLVLANHDPGDDFGILRVTMEDAIRDKTASFFDPEGSRRDYRAILDAFEKDKESLSLHVGIRYGWYDNENAKIGRLVVIKNRLPPSFTVDGPNRFKIQPLLTEEEIVTGYRPDSLDSEIAAFEELGLNPEDLGGLPCCDKCHIMGCNCCCRWPHGHHQNYLWLSPQWWNLLVRLAHRVSQEGLDAINAP